MLKEPRIQTIVVRVYAPSWLVVDLPFASRKTLSNGNPSDGACPTRALEAEDA